MQTRSHVASHLGRSTQFRKIRYFFFLIRYELIKQTADRFSLAIHLSLPSPSSDQENTRFGFNHHQSSDDHPCDLDATNQDEESSENSTYDCRHDASTLQMRSDR